MKLTIITTNDSIYTKEDFNKIDTTDLVQTRSEYSIRQILDDAIVRDNNELLQGVHAEVTSINNSGNPLVFDLITKGNSDTKPMVVFCSYREHIDSMLLTDNDFNFLIEHNSTKTKRLMFTHISVGSNKIQIIEPYKHIVVDMDLDVYLAKVKEDIDHNFIYTEASLALD